MSKNLIDTNLIIRFLVNDNPLKASKVEKLLRNPKNNNILLDTIIAEIVWVLTSYYDLDKPEVIEKIESLIHVGTVECNSVLISKALAIWKTSSLSYIDAYLVAVAELGKITLYSYDKKLQSMANLTVREPD